MEGTGELIILKILHEIDQGPPEEGGLGSCAPPLMLLPPGPSRRDGVAVAVLPLASCPHGVWWVPPLPHQGNTNLGILSRTLQKGGMLLHQQAPNVYGPALGLAALGRPGEESSPGPVSWTESWPVGLVWAPTGADGGQSLWRCPDVPTLCVPTVSANVPPTFLLNMSLVNLPEDLPVGE